MATKAKDLEAKNEKKSEAKSSVSGSKKTLKERSAARKQRQEQQYQQTLAPIESRLSGMEMDAASVGTPAGGMATAGAATGGGGGSSPFKFASQTDAPEKTQATETGCPGGVCPTRTGTTTTTVTSNTGYDAPTPEEIEELRATIFGSPQPAAEGTPMAMDVQPQKTAALTPSQVVDSLELSGASTTDISGGQDLDPITTAEVAAGQNAVSEDAYEESVDLYEREIARLMIENKRIQALNVGTEEKPGMPSSRFGEKSLLDKQWAFNSQILADYNTKLVQLKINHQQNIDNRPLKESVAKANMAIAREATSAANLSDVQAAATAEATASQTSVNVNKAIDGFTRASTNGSVSDMVKSKFAANLHLTQFMATQAEPSMVAEIEGGAEASKTQAPVAEGARFSQAFNTELQRAITRLEDGFDQIGMTVGFRNFQGIAALPNLDQEERNQAQNRAVASVVNYHIESVITDPATGKVDYGMLDDNRIKAARMQLNQTAQMFMAQERQRGEAADVNGILVYFDAIDAQFEQTIQGLGVQDRSNLDRMLPGLKDEPVRDPAGMQETLF